MGAMHPDPLQHARSAARHSTTSSVVPPRTPESATLLAWLDSGLRAARPGRILAEYRAVLSEPDTEHIAVHVAGRPASHALARLCTVEAGGRSLRLGMIGLVYTDPAHRRQGLAARCLALALRRLASRGAGATVLWSDQPEYYERLGFLPVGRERLLTVDAEACRAAGGPRSGELQVAPPSAADWAALEGLYAAKPARVHRQPGKLAALSAAPECRLVVCRDGSVPVAYAALGKGDDFRGVVHEWAGSADGVLACLGVLLEETSDGEPAPDGLLLAGPVDEPALEALLGVGTPALERPFGLVHLGDAEGVFEALAGTHPGLAGLSLRPAAAGYRLGVPEHEIVLESRQALDLLFGPGLPLGALESLDAKQQRAIREQFPWPLFVWGFDSI